jgi:hypothetical protein
MRLRRLFHRDVCLALALVRLLQRRRRLLSFLSLPRVLITVRPGLDLTQVRRQM